jgi:hypothetical protein
MIHARFLMSLKRRRGRPSAWLSAERSAAAVRPCGPDGPALITNVAGHDPCAPKARMDHSFIVGLKRRRRIRASGFPRNDPRRPFGLAALRADANNQRQNHKDPSCFTSDQRFADAPAHTGRAIPRASAEPAQRAGKRERASRPMARKSQVGGRPRRRLRPA